MYVRTFLFPQVGQSASVVPFIGCFAQMNTSGKSMHAWELILKYYELKNGERYNSTPARKLSQSFNLDIVGGTAISNKQVRVWGYSCGVCCAECWELGRVLSRNLGHLAQNQLEHFESYERKLNICCVFRTEPCY